jgi:hypothetical protein
LTTKKPVVVRIADTSQLRKLPAPMAQRVAARLKGNGGEAGTGQGANGAAPASASTGASTTGDAGNTGNAAVRVPAGGSALEQKSGDTGGPGAAQGGVGGPGGARGTTGGQGGDLQQAITRLPASKLSDLQKGDAVMIVATSDNTGAAGGVVAITLLSGVEPILQASPSGQSILTPWSMSGAPGGDAAQ